MPSTSSPRAATARPRASRRSASAGASGGTPRTCWLEDLYVGADARGAGLGRALTEAVIDRARERGCRRVELDVNTENPAALALYRSLGFETGKTGGQDLLMRRRV